MRITNKYMFALNVPDNGMEQQMHKMQCSVYWQTLQPKMQTPIVHDYIPDGVL